MQVSRSIICASIKTALATPSMRPASSSKSFVSMGCISVLGVAMPTLCTQKAIGRSSSAAICLEAVLPRARRAFQ